jgi:predicted membrane channel-forming protein YqfA (hemolysin III family)
MAVLAMIASTYMTFVFHPFENDATNASLSVTLTLLFWVMVALGDWYEGKIEKRIKNLEKKLEDMEKGGEK